MNDLKQTVQEFYYEIYEVLGYSPTYCQRMANLTTHRFLKELDKNTVPCPTCDGEKVVEFTDHNSHCGVSSKWCPTCHGNGSRTLQEALRESAWLPYDLKRAYWEEFEVREFHSLRELVA